MSTEGGYDLEALESSLEATITGLTGPAETPAAAALDEPGSEPTEVGRAAVALVRAAQRRDWPGL